MVELITFMIASAGITYIIVYGSILDPIRSWIANRNNYVGELLSCTLCTGFWVGLILSTLSTISAPYAAGIAAIAAMTADHIIDLIRELGSFAAIASSYLQNINLSKVDKDLTDDLVEDITDEI